MAASKEPALVHDRPTQTTCPRCGYDLRGERATWGDAWPLRGRCVRMPQAGIVALATTVMAALVTLLLLAIGPGDVLVGLLRYTV